MNSFMDTFLIGATVVLGAYFVIKVFVAFKVARQRTNYANRGITAIDGIEGEDFVELITGIFKANDYSVKNVTEDDSDADLIISKDDKTTVVLALRHIKNLNWQIVDSAIKARGDHSCKSAMVITNIGFTNTAKKYADENNIELIGREVLTEMYLKTKGEIEDDDR